jgi:hypothetical protein
MTKKLLVPILISPYLGGQSILFHRSQQITPGSGPTGLKIGEGVLWY